MAQKRLSWINYSPPLIDNGSLNVDAAIFETTAPPNENNRDALYTKFYNVADSPHDAFNVHNVVHDQFRRFVAYDPDDPDSDEEVEITAVFPSRFTVYGPENDPGSFYATTGHDTLKEVFRRYRDSTGDEAATVQIREIDLPCLEDSLQGAEVVGYSLRNVSGQTPYRVLQAEGPQISRNNEARDLVSRADRMRSITYELSRGSMFITLRIQNDGVVTFRNYPGDSIALGIINELDPLIEDCSDTISVRVGQRRGR